MIPCLQNVISCCQDPGLLEGRVNLRQVKAGSVVAHQGDQVSLALCGTEVYLTEHVCLPKGNGHVFQVTHATFNSQGQ